MSDEELIARLRDRPFRLGFESEEQAKERRQKEREIAADRIEALVKERDQWVEHTKNAVWSDSEELKLANDRIEALTAENKILRDAVYIDDLTVTMQANDRMMALAGIGRALDLLNADMVVEAKTALRAARAELGWGAA